MRFQDPNSLSNNTDQYRVEQTAENDNDQASVAHHTSVRHQIVVVFFSRSLFTFTHSFRILQEMLIGLDWIGWVHLLLLMLLAMLIHFHLSFMFVFKFCGLH